MTKEMKLAYLLQSDRSRFVLMAYKTNIHSFIQSPAHKLAKWQKENDKEKKRFTHSPRLALKNVYNIHFDQLYNQCHLLNIGGGKWNNWIMTSECAFNLT